MVRAKFYTIIWLARLLVTPTIGLWQKRLAWRSRGKPRLRHNIKLKLSWRSANGGKWSMEFEKNSLPLEENQHETNSNSKKNQS